MNDRFLGDDLDCLEALDILDILDFLEIFPPANIQKNKPAYGKT
jgi:hypothetical protein